MIKFLNSLTKDLKEDLWLIESMLFNPRFEKHDEDGKTLRIYMYGEKTLLLRRIEYLITRMERIKEYCTSEINGTFYNDYFKEYEGTDFESEYTSNSVYSYILGIWENHPEPLLTDDIKEWIEQHAAVSSKMAEGLNKFFPTIGQYKQNEEGEMEKVSLLDCQIDDNLQAGARLVNADVVNKRIARIKEIATAKGNIGSILELIID